VITNQSGIAAGHYTASDTERLHEYMCEKLGEVGVELDAIAYCPHPQVANCDCRKPGTGMAAIVESQLGQPIDYAASWTIGDKLSDFGFGKSLGTKTALIRSQYWNEMESKPEADLIVDCLYDAARQITGMAHAENHVS
jgi:histidinol-phosphate phosphatase family protein